MRSVGGDWEYWEDNLTFGRLRAIRKSEEEIPPLHKTAYLLGIYFGIYPKPRELEPQAPAHWLMPKGGDAGMFMAEFGEFRNISGS